MEAKEFDRIQEISKKLKAIFSRDNVGGLNGMEDYLVSAVEEATKNADQPSGVLVELKEWEELYDDVAAKLNTANYTLSAIKQLISNRESGLTQRAPDFANARQKMVSCPNCRLVFNIESPAPQSG